MRFNIFLFLVFILASNVQSQDLDKIYKRQANVQSCAPGELNQSEIDLVLKKVNQIRALHKLAPVEYEYSTQQASMEGCLNIVASGESGHKDDPSSECYTPGGGEARMKSNLFAGGGGSPVFYSSEDIIIGWLIDDHNADKANEYKVGHRRAIINPFLKKFSFGRAEGYTKAGNQYMVAANFHYQDYVTNGANTPNDFVAYPYEDYPTDFFNKDFYLSFNVLADKTNLWNNESVDLSNAQITMKDANNNNIDITAILFDYEGWGSYPNNLSWKAANLQNDTKYFVEITNINVNGQNKNYSYWFRLTNIDHSKKPQTPELVTPANGSENIKINTTISWNSIQNASYYKFQLADNPSFNNPIANIDNQFNNGYNASGLKFKTKYYWRAAAGNDAGLSEWSPTWNFTTSDSKPVATVLQSPADKQVINTNTPKLEWQDIPSAESYLVQVSIDANFSGFNVKYSKNIVNNYVEIPNGLLEVQTNYYWRVQSKNSEGTSNWSPVWSFNTGMALPAISIIYPEDKSSNIPLTPQLKWAKIDEATSYEIQLNFLNDFENGAMINELNWQENSYSVPMGLLKENTTYYWRVKAKNSSGSSNWSNIYTFKTEQVNSVDDLNKQATLNQHKNIVIINSDLDIQNIKIVDYFGHTVINELFNKKQYKIDLSIYPNGAYFIIATINGKANYFKVLNY
ncbi:MAG TPA: CAP domain-containing protein [Candidatus Kapabacteria bacterium]|nr:CAP domain-containing protein [Candidatus Kapabacteria bacterium]